MPSYGHVYHLDRSRDFGVIAGQDGLMCLFEKTEGKTWDKLEEGQVVSYSYDHVGKSKLIGLVSNVRISKKDIGPAPRSMSSALEADETIGVAELVQAGKTGTVHRVIPVVPGAPDKEVQIDMDGGPRISVLSPPGVIRATLKKDDRVRVTKEGGKEVVTRI